MKPMKSIFIIRSISEIEHNVIIIKERTIPMVKKILKWIGKVIFIVSLGFIGGCLSPYVISKIQVLFGEPPVINVDTISIANTYIVFTTFIFTAIAIIVAVASYLFAQEAAKSRQIQEQTLFSDLIKSCTEKPELGRDLISKLLENENVIEHFEKRLNDKIDDILSKRCQLSQESERVSKERTSALKGMIIKTDNQGDKL
ncbi:hypothetical protein [Neisseria sp. HMSC075C12]|uniref:hypothetical protein n=1 Tax=Neisseria sp. HMSC075C12 TaxID=1739282 RepID=UPI00114C9905|nr:hypothetical protein [Neisseria sp. HMSC075C12]